MIRCCFLTGLFAFALLLATQSEVQAGSQSNGSSAMNNVGSQAAYKQSIRDMPLLERPNRPGHFYGNTVRRIYAVRHGR